MYSFRILVSSERRHPTIAKKPAIRFIIDTFNPLGRFERQESILNEFNENLEKFVVATTRRSNYDLRRRTI